MSASRIGGGFDSGGSGSASGSGSLSSLSGSGYDAKSKPPGAAGGAATAFAALTPQTMARLKVAQVLGGIAVLFFFFHLSNVLRPTGGGVGSSALRGMDEGCATVWCESEQEKYVFAVVADLDRQSKVEGLKPKEAAWRSFFKKGTLQKTASGWEIDWANDIELTTRLGEDGRGLELSELIAWQGGLYTFDDRSGVVFELSRAHQCIPRYVLMEGDGATTKGQKTEWATVKDGDLYVGSFGKLYTNQAGEVTSTNNMWVSIIRPSGRVDHEDWTRRYQYMQEVTGSVHPGYMIHEAIHWDAATRQWFVLPRRVSAEPFDEKKDEVMGSNLVLVFNEDVTELARQFSVGPQVPTHGWSSFKFVPWTSNKVIIALRSMEIEDKATGAGEQATFVTIFGIDGEVFLEEQMIPGAHKFEGIEFI